MSTFRVVRAINKKLIHDTCGRTIRQTFFKEGHQDRFRDHCNGGLQCGRKTGLNSDYNKEKWGFTAKEQDGGLWIDILKVEVLVKQI